VTVRTSVASCLSEGLLAVFPFFPVPMQPLFLDVISSHLNFSSLTAVCLPCLPLLAFLAHLLSRHPSFSRCSWSPFTRSRPTRSFLFSLGIDSLPPVLRFASQVDPSTLVRADAVQLCRCFVPVSRCRDRPVFFPSRATSPC